MLVGAASPVACGMPLLPRTANPVVGFAREREPRVGAFRPDLSAWPKAFKPRRSESWEPRLGKE